VRLLAAAAWNPELVALRERSSAAAAPGVELAFAAVGVGLVESAVGTARALAEHRPDVAVLVGTCGAFAGASLASGSVVVGARVRLVDASALAGDAEIPAPMPVDEPLDRVLHDAFAGAGAKSVQIANTVGITVSDVLASKLAARSDVEHLEAFAFARACAAARVPCAVVLAVANAVGSRGRAEWLASHVNASASAGALVYDALGAVLRTSTTARSPGRP